MIAGGFGIGTPAGVPDEVARVVTYCDEHRTGWKAHSQTPRTDVEARESFPPSLPREREGVSENGPLVARITPFFHFDLVAALRAVELNSEERLSREETLSDKQVDISTSVA